MNYKNERRITVEVHFGYYKQGDDFGHCGGDLLSFANLHQRIAQNALNMYDLIPPEAREYVTGDGDTHWCSLTGPESVMNLLVERKYAHNIERDDDDDDNEYYDEEHYDEENENDPIDEPEEVDIIKNN